MSSGSSGSSSSSSACHTLVENLVENCCSNPQGIFLEYFDSGNFVSLTFVSALKLVFNLVEFLNKINTRKDIIGIYSEGRKECLILEMAVQLHGAPTCLIPENFSVESFESIVEETGMCVCFMSSKKAEILYESLSFEKMELDEIILLDNFKYKNRLNSNTIKSCYYEDLIKAETNNFNWDSIIEINQEEESEKQENPLKNELRTKKKESTKIWHRGEIIKTEILALARKRQNYKTIVSHMCSLGVKFPNLNDFATIIYENEDCKMGGKMFSNWIFPNLAEYLCSEKLFKSKEKDTLAVFADNYNYRTHLSVILAFYKKALIKFMPETLKEFSKKVGQQSNVTVLCVDNEMLENIENIIVSKFNESGVLEKISHKINKNTSEIAKQVNSEIGNQLRTLIVTDIKLPKRSTIKNIKKNTEINILSFNIADCIPIFKLNEFRGSKEPISVGEVYYWPYFIRNQQSGRR